MAAFIVDSLVRNRFPCQYFFVTEESQSLDIHTLLARSIVYQLVPTTPWLAHRICADAEQGMDFKSMSGHQLFEQLLRPIFKHGEQKRPLYLVIDGLTDYPVPLIISLIKDLVDLASTSLPLRILISGRQSYERRQLGSLPAFTSWAEVSVAHPEDIRNYARSALKDGLPSKDREVLAQQLGSKSLNNFLVRSQAPLILNKPADQAVDTHCG